MTDRINVEKHIRRSLEAPLTDVIPQMREAVAAIMHGHAAYEQGKFPIQWPNQSFYAAPKDGGDAKPPAYVRFSYHPSPPRVRTIGENPRLLLRGHIILGCYVPEGAGEDVADNLANAAMSAYPYAASFVREGFDTRIELVDPKSAFGSLGRYYKPVFVNWSCWRAS